MASYRERHPARFLPEALRGTARRFAAVGVLPVYDEAGELPGTLRSLSAALAAGPEREIAIFAVFNHPPAAPADTVAADRFLAERLAASDPEVCGTLKYGKDLFVIDLGENREGVGAARKAGMDAALAVLDPAAPGEGLIASLDADAPVSPDYWSRLLAWSAEHERYAGAVTHFEHRFAADPALCRAGQCYELYLRDYARQCRECGSRYGFWTLGSAFAVHARDYPRAGGMRRRAGGEDFYFLEALRKVGRIGLVPEATVYPSGRPSARVPFGTGPAVRRLAETPEEALLVNPACFAELAHLYRSAAAADYAGLTDLPKLLAASRVGRYLAGEYDFAEVWPKIVRNTPQRKEALLDALHRFADGLFMLRFRHHLEASEPELFAPQVLTGEVETMLAEARKQDRALTDFA